MFVWVVITQTSAAMASDNLSSQLIPVRGSLIWIFNQVYSNYGYLSHRDCLTSFLLPPYSIVRRGLILTRNGGSEHIRISNLF